MGYLQSMQTAALHLLSPAFQMGHSMQPSVVPYFGTAIPLKSILRRQPRPQLLINSSRLDTMKKQRQGLNKLFSVFVMVWRCAYGMVILLGFLAPLNLRLKRWANRQGLDCVRLCVRPVGVSTLSNINGNIFETRRSITITFYLKHHWDGWIAADRFRTLVSMATENSIV